MFAFGNYAIEAVEECWSDPAYVVPIRVRGPETFNLLAVWAQTTSGVPGYVGNVLAAITKYERFIGSGPTVIAGDFNSNVLWDRLGVPGHATLVTKLTALGLYSAYHEHRCEAHGPSSRRPSS